MILALMTLALMIVAVILLVLAAFSDGRLGWLGLAFWAFSTIAGRF